MKRILVFAVILSMALGVTAFQCSSTEMTGAKLYIQQKKYDKAQEMLEQELAKNPKNDEANYWIGFIKGENDDVEGMIEAYEASSGVSSKFAKDIENNKKYFWGKRFNAGVALFNKASKATDEDTIKMFFDKSIRSFNEAIMCQPDSAGTYLNLAFAQMNAGKNDEAIPTWKRIIELKPTSDAYAAVGEIYIQKAYDAGDDKTEAEKNYNEAIKILEAGRKAFPEDNIILRDLSNAYVGANKIDVAIEAFKAGVAQEPENKFYRYNYGSLLLNIEDYASAAVQLQKAVDLDAEYMNALYNLGVTYVKWGAKMREELEAKEDDSKEDSSKEYLKQFELAIPPMEKYLELKPDEPAIWELLGKVYANLGMAEKSKEAFEKADQK
ncbi:MAG: tetratricopeptide repeat protein [Melioribacteraceae bacterium]|nr:tetratricopeptide repeat protein [Melioribacteraceae bacterium]